MSDFEAASIGEHAAGVRHAVSCEAIPAAPEMQSAASSHLRTAEPERLAAAVMATRRNETAV